MLDIVALQSCSTHNYLNIVPSYWDSYTLAVVTESHADQHHTTVFVTAGLTAAYNSYDKIIEEEELHFQ